MRRLKIPTLLGAFITLLDDRLGETIVLPLLPFLLEQFTTSATTLGFLTGTYAISQFAAAPLIGAMSDRFGRKPIMITCVSGSVIGICLFALTVSLNWDNYLPLWASALPLSLLLPVDKPKVARAPVNTEATNVISELPDFLTIGSST